MALHEPRTDAVGEALLGPNPRHETRGEAAGAECGVQELDGQTPLVVSCDAPVTNRHLRLAKVRAVDDHDPAGGRDGRERAKLGRGRAKAIRELGFKPRQSFWELDHVVPLSRGGRSSWDNVVAACIPCNSKKGNRTPTGAGMNLIRLPRKPAGHPLLRAHWLGTVHDEWKTFLDEAYWNVELSDDVMPESDSGES